MKPKQVLTVLLLCLSSFLQFVPIVHAANPAFDTSSACQAGVATSCTTAGATPAGTNELIVVTIATGGSALATDRLVSTVIDSKSDSFKFAQNNTGHNTFTNYIHTYIAYAFTSSTASQTVTVSFNSANSHGIVQVAYFTNSANFVPVTAIGSCVSACGTAMTTSSSVSDDGNSIDIGALGSSDNTNFGALVGSGYTKLAGAGAGYCTQGGSDAACGEYKLPNSGGSTNFPGTGYTGIWVEAGAVFGIASTVTVVGPCTFFQLQCWWYPMLFITLFTGAFLVVAGVRHVRPKGAMHLFLTGMTFGSTIAVIFGIMNILIPLMLLLLNTLYVLRSGN